MIDPRKQLADERVLALRCPVDAWPRMLLGAAPIPDTWMGLIIRPDGRRWVVPAGEMPRGDAGDTLVLIRNRVIVSPLTLERVVASDGHMIDAAVELLLRCPMREDELAAFRATLLESETFSLPELEKAVRDAGGVEALREFIKSQPARRLVHEDVRDALAEHMRAALRRFLFAAGLEIERMGAISFVSGTLIEEEARASDTARRAREIESRRMVEEAALAATRRRVEGLGAILDKLRAYEHAGSGRWRELLPALTPSERGRLLESLWRITPDRHVAQAIVVVAGMEVLWLDPAAPDRITRRHTLPVELGGLRSVSTATAAKRGSPTGDRPPAGLSSSVSVGEDRAEAGPPADTLLVGAATGVWVLSATDGSCVAKLAAASDSAPTTGFNSAARNGEFTVAAHSQLGLWAWEEPHAGARLIEPKGGVPKIIRGVIATHDGHFLVGVDDAVRVFGPDLSPLRTLEIGRGAVHGIAVDHDRIFATTSDGLLLADNWRSPNVWEVLYRGREVLEGVQRRRWDDLIELVIPGGEDGVLGVYGDEGVVARLMVARVPIRRAWACDDLIVGLSASRDRLVVLNANASEPAPRDVPLARLTGRSIQDVCILTRAGQ